MAAGAGTPTPSSTTIASTGAVYSTSMAPVAVRWRGSRLRSNSIPAVLFTTPTATNLCAGNTQLKAFRERSSPVCTGGGGEEAEKTWEIEKIEQKKKDKAKIRAEIAYLFRWSYVQYPRHPYSPTSPSSSTPLPLLFSSYILVSILVCGRPHRLGWR